jgi:predicted ThiF/HesA family dinucleotide-utilizing enzyme
VTAGFKVVGLGGVGGVVARYLSVFLAARDEDDRLVLVDGDRFEAKNAARMLFSGEGNKAEIVAADLRAALPESRLSLVAVPEYVTAENVSRLIREGDVILLCVDNHATRKLVNDACAALDAVTLVSGGNDGVGEDADGTVQRGTYGNVQVHLRRAGADATPPLTARHPEIEEPADDLPTDQGCAELLSSVPQILFTNLQTAAAMLSTLRLLLEDELHYSELCFDIHDALMRPLPVP